MWCDAIWARRQETLKEYQEKKQAAGPSASLGRKVSEQHQQVLLASNRLLLCLLHSPARCSARTLVKRPNARSCYHSVALPVGVRQH